MRVMLLVGLASAAGLALFPRLGVVSDGFGAALVWLMPLAFALHVAEEFAWPGGFAEWYVAYRPRFASAFSPAYAFRVNAYPGAAAVLVSLGVFDYRGAFSRIGITAWLTFLAVLAFNALLHLWGTVRTRSYSPGAVTGGLLYLPLAVVAFSHFVRTGAIDVVSAILAVILASQFQRILDQFKTRRRQTA